METMPRGSNMELNVNEQVYVLKRITDTCRRHENSTLPVKELAVLRVQFPAILLPVQQGDIFAGRLTYPAVCFTPQADGNEGGLGYVFSSDKFEKLEKSPGLDVDSLKILGEIKQFWQNRNTSRKVRESYSESLKKALPSDNWTGTSGVAFPLYRLAGTQLNYKKLLKQGLPGLKSELEAEASSSVSAGERIFLESAAGAIEVVSDCCIYYAEMVEQMSQVAPSRSAKNELLQMAVVLRAITIRPPQNLREAIQLSFMYCLVSGSLNYGRIDDYLGPFLLNDLESGRLNKEEALRLMEGWWKMMIARNTPYDGRATVGGRGRENEKAADEFAMLAMDTAARVKDILPQLTLRFFNGQNPALFEKGLQTIGEGCTFPMLYNDDVIIPAFSRAAGISEDEACHYLPYGCGEYMLNHRGISTPSGIINLLKSLEITLHGGVDPVSGEKMVLQNVITNFPDFDSLWKAYCEQTEFYINNLAIQEDLEYIVTGKDAPFLLFSVLYDDCIAKKKPLLSGGVRYPGGTLEIYGFTNVVDSLIAIKKLVYDNSKYSLDQIREAMANDYEGYESLRRELIDQPKYGNDIDEADDMAVKVHEHVCRFTRAQAMNTSLHHYLVVNINNDANTTLGRYTHASADGRKAFSSMSNGNAANMGMDREGATALLNSLVKLDNSIHAGTVQNLKFSKEMFTQYLPMTKALLKTYFENGGSQIMITVVGKEELEDAMQFPEKYPHLIVRVGGFSARFIDLSHEVQKEILQRTLY